MRKERNRGFNARATRAIKTLWRRSGRIEPLKIWARKKARGHDGHAAMCKAWLERKAAC